MHNKQVTGGIGYYKEKSEALWLLTIINFYKQHLIVIYLYIVGNNVAGYRAARQLIIQCIYLASHCSAIHTLWLINYG